jgi:hypothetical protein
MSSLLTVKAPSTEYWIVRVLVHHGRKVQLSWLTPGERSATQAEIDAGSFLMLGDGCIAEPVERCDEEPKAHERREELRKEFPKEDFRVVMLAPELDPVIGGRK